jgi:hypothetical protein
MEETKVTTETAGPQAQPSVEDLAAHDYMKSIPEYKEALKFLSKKQHARVALALMEYPLNKIEFKMGTEETKVFMLGIKIMDCRFVIIKAAMDMKKEEIQEMMKTENKENVN